MKCFNIPIHWHSLDSALGGGILSGEVVELFGASGCGKTKLGLRVSKLVWIMNKWNVLIIRIHWHSLDSALGGGILSGEVVELFGPSGCGKTKLGLRVSKLVWIMNKWNVLIIRIHWHSLDSALGGGILSGEIVEIFGPSGCGKTKLGLRVSKLVWIMNKWNVLIIRIHWHSLDSALGGGILSGEVVELFGPSGCGKTKLGLRVSKLVWIMNKWNVLIIRIHWHSLDSALGGGILSGEIAELFGPSGCGKTKLGLRVSKLVWIMNKWNVLIIRIHWHSLDSALGGGILSGEVVELFGPSGCGKTKLGLRVSKLVWIMNKWNVLIIRIHWHSLDSALGGGILSGEVVELFGPSGCGKTKLGLRVSKLVWIMNKWNVLIIRIHWHSLDSALGGGILSGEVVELFGASGCGKTKLGLRVSVSQLCKERPVLYMDTSAAISAQGVIQMFTALNQEVIIHYL